MRARIAERVAEAGGWLAADVDCIRAEEVAAWERRRAEQDEMGHIATGVFGLAATLRRERLAALYERRRVGYGEDAASEWLHRVRDEAAWIAGQADAVLGELAPD